MANEQYIAQLKETFATSVPSRIAAFFGEPIQVHHPVVDYDKKCGYWHSPEIPECFWLVQGVGGAVQYPKNYLKEAYKLVRERGGVCIADEVRFTFCIF